MGFATDDATGVIVLRADTLAPVRRLNYPAGNSPARLSWLSPTLLVFGARVLDEETGIDEPTRIVKIVDIATGTEPSMRYEVGAARLGRSRVDPGAMLQQDFSRRGSRAAVFRIPDWPEVLRVDDRGDLRRDLLNERIAEGPDDRPLGWFVLGLRDEPRWFVARLPEERLEIHRHVDGDWSLFWEGEAQQAPFLPIEPASDGATWVELPRAGELMAYGLRDDATGEIRVVAESEGVQFDYSFWSVDRLHLLAVMDDPGRARWRIVDDAHPEGRAFKLLVEAFPDHALRVLGRSDDGRRLLVNAFSDRDPGQMYLFDMRSGQARFIQARLDGLDPAQMAATRDIRFANRDGTPLQGYLTLPPGREARDLPLVLMPHGGPYGVRDHWGFDPVLQVLATRGYAVLQVNYRGSSGFGEAFQRSGYRGWGTLIQDDLADGVRWAVGEGIADPARVCVFGASFGGYSALMGPIRSPGTFRCGIGYVAPYDLAALRQRYVMDGNRPVLAFLAETLPEDRAELRAQSPADRAGEIRIPLMLAHGGEDDRVQNRQFNRMRRELERAGNPPEVVFVREAEGHGFRKLEHRVEFYTEVLAFLDRHIGEGRAAAPATAEPASPGAAE
jgi:dienelactone hydrolase